MKDLILIKKLLIILFISTAFISEMNAHWVPLNNKSTSLTPPNVTILSDNSHSTVIKIDLSGFELEDLFLGGKTFNKLDLLSEIFISKPGYPELPYLAKVLAIPDDGGISVEVIETGEVEVFRNIHVQPARLSWIEGEPETPYDENTNAYKSADIYPKELATIEPPSVFRDFRIARLSVFPIRYIPSKNEIHAVSSITVKINYGKGEIVNPKATDTKAIAPSFGKLYRSFIFNYQSVLDSRYNGNEEGRDVMLCIMPDDFVDTFQSYADWKTQSGTEVHITKFSEIGANTSNSTIIKDHITDAYHNWEHPPTYVLLVGDYSVFPVKLVMYDYTFASEDFFVEIDGDDFFPEMMIGRFTNQNAYKLQVIANKLIKYEKEPYTADTDWFKKAICCSNNEFESQVATKHFAADVMLMDGGFTSVDTMMSDGSGGGYGCSYGLTDVTGAINNGRSFLNYRGEGWVNGWNANCYDFQTMDVSNLINVDKLTFVTSIGCGVAMFNNYSTNCFGEEWLELGTVDSPRGAVAFVGPTSVTHTTYNNRIDKGIYVGMFQEGMDTPGQALLRGKLYVYNVFGTDPMVEYNYRVFCILGDPSTHIWKDIPLAVNVVHASSVPVGYNQTGFVVTSTLTGDPMVNAEVYIVGDDVYSKGICDSTGTVVVDITPEVQQTLSVVVRGGNVIPYEGTIDVIELAEYVGPEEYPIIVDIDGNTDGIINPNENCNITFKLKNWGTQTSNNVVATLTVVETEFADVITTEAISFGDLPSGSSFIGEPFLIHILPGCPVGQVVTLELHVTSSTGAWEYSYPIEVMGCELTYNSFVVNDQDVGNLNKNYRMDPGETVELYITVNNVGVDIAPNVAGVLTSNDPYITIDDAIGSFGSMDTSSISTNIDDYFVASIDPMCPTNYYAEYSLNLVTNNGNYPYETVLTFVIPVAVPLPTDYTGPDAYGYYAYSNIDTIYEQSPVYEWIEINQVGEELVVPPGLSDYTSTVELPFQFKYYGSYYDEIRISTDGWIAFGGGDQVQSYNFPLPHFDSVNCMVAPFWDDLHKGYNEPGEIFYYYDPISRNIIIEWDGIGHNEYSVNPVNEYFQVVLLNPLYYPTTTGDGELVFQYKSVVKKSGITVGIEDDSQEIGLQYVYNNEYDSTASPIIAGTAIKFTTESPLVTVDVDEKPSQITEVSCLKQNIPNPFYSSTTISYSVSRQMHVSLRIYNVNGELIKSFYDGLQSAGNYSVIWDGTNEEGSSVSTGVYFYRIVADSSVETKKLIYYN